MTPPKSLTAAVGLLGSNASALRAVGSTDNGPCWTISLRGSRAFEGWEKLGYFAKDTGFWPVIVSAFPNPEVNDAHEQIKSWFGLDDGEESEKTKRKTPAEIIEEARALPFEIYADQEHDPKFLRDKSLRKAEHFDRIPGAEIMAAHYRESAARYLEFKKEEIDPDACLIPPRQNRNPPQYELQCTQWCDLDTYRSYEAGEVTVLFVPTTYSWEVPAYLSYTTRAGDLSPSVHVAALKWLSVCFGADLVGLDPRVLEVYPRRKPTGKREAVLAAHLLGTYSSCPVTSENESASLDELAFYLMESKYWSFCWP